MHKHLTGHIYYRSPIESDDNCGTCNGARCSSCKTVYTVDGIDEKIFTSKDEAADAEEQLNSILPPDVKHIGEPMFFVKDGILYVTLYQHNKTAGVGGYQDFECNKGSKIYQEKYDEIAERHRRYDICTCTDKAKESSANPCSKFGCCDPRCFHEMKEHGRTEMKWYP